MSAYLDMTTDVAPENSWDETLDPADPEQMRALARRMADDMLDYLVNVRARPAWQPVPSSVAASFDQPIPRAAQPAENVYADFCASVLPYPLGNIHPRFWGWVIGTGTVFGAFAELLAGAMNTNAAGAASAPVLLEEQVLRWLRELMSFPREASGLLVSGGSVANFVGLAAGLQAQLGADLVEHGVLGLTARPIVYASVETHFSVARAVRLLGLGNDSYRAIPTTADFRIDIGALQAAIAADRAAGHQPAILVGNAGTVGQGAFDPLAELRAIADRHDMWFHVDGAFGALAELVPELRPLTAGMSAADSLAFDLHKWLHVPIDSACVLVRDAAAHHTAFRASGAYVKDLGRGAGVQPNRFTDYGLQQSRSARGLKAWLALRHFGVDALARMIRKNVEQAHYLGSLIEREKRLELLAPVTLNVVCFRYAAAGRSEPELDALNREILLQLQERGIAVPSHTTVNGRLALRCALSNHRTRGGDLQFLVAAVLEIGGELTA